MEMQKNIFETLLGEAPSLFEKDDDQDMQMEGGSFGSKLSISSSSSNNSYSNQESPMPCKHDFSYKKTNFEKGLHFLLSILIAACAIKMFISTKQQVLPAAYLMFKASAGVADEMQNQLNKSIARVFFSTIIGVLAICLGLSVNQSAQIYKLELSLESSILFVLGFSRFYQSYLVIQQPPQNPENKDIQEQKKGLSKAQIVEGILELVVVVTVSSLLWMCGKLDPQTICNDTLITTLIFIVISATDKIFDNYHNLGSTDLVTTANSVWNLWITMAYLSMVWIYRQFSDKAATERIVFGHVLALYAVIHFFQFAIRCKMSWLLVKYLIGMVAMNLGLAAAYFQMYNKNLALVLASLSVVIVLLLTLNCLLHKMKTSPKSKKPLLDSNANDDEKWGKELKWKKRAL